MRGLWFRPRSDSGSWGGETPFFVVNSVSNPSFGTKAKEAETMEKAEGVNLENLLQFLSFEVSICCVV